jgi:hypothetical protein
MLVSRVLDHLVSSGRGPVLAVATSLAFALAIAPAEARKNPRFDPPPFSGAFEFSDVTPGTQLTECPQAGLKGARPRPLDRRERDEVERISERSGDIRLNQDYACSPQNETSIAINPRAPRNVLGGANDYRLGYGTSGFYASTDGGRTFYDGIIPVPSVPTGDNLDGGGDPAIAYDRDGVAYYAEINFNRTDDTNGIFVMRSTNGGFTWTRACVPIDATPGDPADDQARCNAGAGDPRQPGDGVVSYFQDEDGVVDGSVPFDDKEYIAAGPRPAAAGGPKCFTPMTHAPVSCNPAVVGSDRLYVTWTRFATNGEAEIHVSWSDDQARSWSPPRAISGSAPFCTFGIGSACDFNQFSTPTVHPVSGALGVAFENYNTPDENQYLFVRSQDGGQTFTPPSFVTPVFDRNYPSAGEERPDCIDRGQQGGRDVLTNSCFRVNSGGNVVVDKRPGAFADDYYLVMSDNRNGTNASSNTDVFLFKSTNGGATWVGPTRVNDDRSSLPPGTPRDGQQAGDFGNDQWFPWVDVSASGQLAFGFFDRRLDTSSTRTEWPMSRTRTGNYLTWFFGAGCRVTRADSRQCVAPNAAPIAQPAAPQDQPDGVVPGQGPGFTSADIDNSRLSDVPSNFDYAFRAGIFVGDYNNVAYPNFVTGGRDDRALGFWTDARNGRGSGGPGSNQPGRNPACEQADVFAAFFDPQRRSAGSAGRLAPFEVTPCPKSVREETDDRFHGNDD